MANHTSSYSEKRKRGLVPHAYNLTSHEFQRGAWRNWPSNLSEQRRMEIAASDCAGHDPFRKGHRFVGPQEHTANERRSRMAAVTSTTSI